MIQFEYFNYKLKQNSATKIKQTVGAITPPDGYAFGVLSALTNLETVSSTLITGYNAVFIHTLNSQVPTESAVNALVTDVASGKVDKTNVAYRLYGTDADGNQTTFPIGVNNLRDVQVDGVSVVDTDGIANIDLTGYLQKTGGTLTGDLAFQYNTNNPKLRIIQSGQNTNHLRFINNNYASQSISFDLSQAAIHPLVTGRGHLGTSDIHFGDAHIDKIYTPIINNGYDISVPVTASAQTLALKSEVDLAANSGRMITDQGVWYAKMYASTTVPTGAEYDGKNYADFSQVDSDNNPVIKIYTGASGAWTLTETITPPAEYDGYVPVTSKIWDIAEQAGQQGGRVMWNHQSKDFTPYPQIISFENAALTGVPTAPLPTDASPNDQIATKEYVDSHSSTGGYHPDLFDVKWSDHICNDVQWLRADTFSWQSGAVYQAAYQHLVDDLGTPTTYYGWTVDGEEVYTTSRTPQDGDIVYVDLNNLSDVGLLDSYNSDKDTIIFVYGSRGYAASYVSSQTEYPNAKTETIAGITITYYLAEDGHKLVLPDQESNVQAIYNATGVAWYYILDTENQRFKLPRTKFGFTGLRDTIGKYIEAGLPNISGSFVVYTANNFPQEVDGAFSVENSTHSGESYQYVGNSPKFKFNASDSNSIYGSSTTVQPPATQMYLYFYMGPFTQTALENTAGLNAELFNGKVDVGHQVIEFQAPTADNNYTWYRKYADGWVEQGGRGTLVNSSYTANLPVTMSDTNYFVFTGTDVVPVNNSVCSRKCTAKTTTTVTITGTYASGGGTNYDSGNTIWEVKGMAAS